MPSWLCCASHAPRAKPEEIYQMAQQHASATAAADGAVSGQGRAAARLPPTPVSSEAGGSAAVPTVEVTAPEPARPQFSWERREQVDLSKVTVKNLMEETVLRTDFKGEPCIIENCKESIIVVKGHMSAVTIDDCVDTLIVLGPCSGSVFIRDCFNCSLLSVCGQLRTRDCHSLELVLRCASEPIIEQSTDVTLRPLCLFYPELKEHMKKAGLDVFRNQAVSVHDFTPNQMKCNFRLDKKTISMTENGLRVLANFGVYVDPSRSLFPSELSGKNTLCFAYQGVDNNSEEYQQDRQRLMEELTASPKLAIFCAMDLEMPSWTGGGGAGYEDLPLPTDSFSRISLVGCSGWRDEFAAMITRHGGYILLPAGECDAMEQGLYDVGLLEK